MKKLLIFFAILFFTVSCSIDEDMATLVYFNDAHEISPVDDKQGIRGGIARVKTVIRKIRENNAETIEPHYTRYVIGARNTQPANGNQRRANLVRNPYLW